MISWLAVSYNISLKKPKCDILLIHLQLHLGHLADILVQKDLQYYVHLSQDRSHNISPSIT